MQIIAEGEKQFATLLDAIERGEEVTVTRKGKPVALITPVKSAENGLKETELEEIAEIDKKLAEMEREGIRQAADGLRKLGGELRLDGLTIRDLIIEGRRCSNEWASFKTTQSL